MTNLLVVDDTDQDAESTLRALRGEGDGLHVLRLKDAQQALEYLLRIGAYAQRVSPQPELLISEVQMPRMNGLQLVEALRADDLTRNLPVILFTRSENPLLAAHAQQVGADELVVKPRHAHEYQTRVQAIVHRWLPAEPTAGLPSTPRTAHRFLAAFIERVRTH